jgi:hypothetical protein
MTECRPVESGCCSKAPLTQSCWLAAVDNDFGWIVRIQSAEGPVKPCYSGRDRDMLNGRSYSWEMSIKEGKVRDILCRQRARCLSMSSWNVK